MGNNIIKALPNSLEAEQCVVGCMVLDRQAITEATEELVQDDFYYKQYGIMFKTMLEMNTAGLVVDIVTLQDALKEKDISSEFYDINFIRNLLQSIPTTADVKRYVRIVKNKAILRNIIKVNEEIAKECYEGKSSTDDILAATEKKIFELVKNKGEHEYVPIQKVVVEVLDRISMAAKNKGAVIGISTGFKDLDTYLSGFQLSDFILIAARPSMGKTAFVLNIAENVAVKQGITTAIFSLEMSNVQLVNRMLSLGSMVDADKIRKGQLESEDWNRIMESIDTIAKSNLIIDDTPGITITQMRSKCRKYKMENNLGLVIIDYLQLMSGDGKSDSRQQQISDISRSLKMLARELNVPVIALSQLSRAVEQRPDHRPMLSDLRESGAIEQDADVVMFIYRDDYYHKDSQIKGVAELIIAKQRNGPIGTVKMAWLPEQTRFVDLAKN